MVLVPATVGIALLVGLWPPGRVETSVIRLVDSLPGWLDPVWGVLYDLSVVWALALLAVAVLRRRAFIVVQALAALVLAIAIAAVAARLATGHWPELGALIKGSPGGPVFPGSRLAEAGAVILSVGPHLVRPLERLGRWIFTAGSIGALVASPATPSGVLAGVLIAVAAAAALRLALGTSAGRVGTADVAAALADLGVAAGGLEPAGRQVAGVVAVRATDPAGRPLLVKVHGRDAYDNQLLEKAWRTLLYQDAGPGLRLGRTQVAEHEAFATLLARQAGVPGYDVVRVGTVARDDAVLVLAGDVRPLASVDPIELTGDVLRGSWHALERLQDAHIAHRRIDTSTVALADGKAGFVDYAGATVTPTPRQLLADRAQLLVSTAVVVGPDRALAVAVEALGRDGLADLVPYLQPAALSPALRREVKPSGLDVDALRGAAAAMAGVPEPELVRVRRVTWGTLIQLALLVLAGWAIISYFSGIDWDTVSTSLQEATWGWIALGFVVSQLPRLSQAVATLGSVAADLRYGPVYAMQLATNYMNLALPSYAGRLAMSVRFFQRQGLPPAAAVASGAIDSFASTVVQAVLLAVLLLFSNLTVELDFQSPPSDAWRLIAVVLVLLAATVLVLALVRRVRQAVLGRVREWWPQMRSALGALRTKRKLAYLLLGNLTTEILFAVALGLFVAGLGFRASLAELLLINMTVSLFASFIPVPGGIGVVEFGLTAGLMALGMTEEAALAAVILYRISTFYLPPVWGFFAMRWLQRNRYL